MTHFRLGVTIGILASSLAARTISRGQDTAGANHEHLLTGVSCDDLPARQKRPDFGCFNIASEAGLQFPKRQVYGHLRTYVDRASAEAAKSATGIVVEQDGQVWLSEFGLRNLVVGGGKHMAVVGPLQLPDAKSFTAVLSSGVMRPGESSRVHTHPGPERWYMIAGEQCLETPAGANRAKAGETLTVPPAVPMQLHITGTELRKSLVQVIHDSSAPRGTPSQWTPAGACSHREFLNFVLKVGRAKGSGPADAKAGLAAS